MGAIRLKVSVGAVNFNNYLHITAAKVSNPSHIVWEDWIAGPITSYNYEIPDLDPENYNITYYDAPNNTALGDPRVVHVVNALTNQYIYERRFYRGNGSGPNDPPAGSNTVTDPYFVNKTVTGIQRESFRYLIPNVEWDMVTTVVSIPGDTITTLDGITISDGEVLTVDIQLQAGVIASSGGSIYSGRVDVTSAAYSVLVGDKGKRHRLKCAGSKQICTMPPIASLNQDDEYLFDNSVGGGPDQVLINFSGTDFVLYDGLNTPTPNLPEIWVGRGEKLILAVVDDHFEVILPYQGQGVGKLFMTNHASHPNAGLCNGQIGENALDGDEHPRIWYWIEHCLDSAQIIVDDTVINTSYVHPADKVGCFVIHSTLKKFRLPNWQNHTPKALKNFTTLGVGSDSTRPFNYPGGKQYKAMMDHRHFTVVPNSLNNPTPLPATASMAFQLDASGSPHRYTLSGIAAEPTVSRTSKPIDAVTLNAFPSSDNIVDNIGILIACQF